MTPNALRKEAAALLAEVSARRPPALRRSWREDWLYATDLPMAADQEAVASFLRAVRRAGWRAQREENWIQLSKVPPEPPEGGFAGPFGPEADCCRSVLARHSALLEGNVAPDEEQLIFRLIKAGEEGPAAYEAACRELHQEMAVRLRKKEKLPRISRAFFAEQTSAEFGPG